MYNISKQGDGSEGVGHKKKQNFAIFTKICLYSEFPPLPIQV